MNYFNYFTEIEDEFVKRRGSHMLVSPLDWSLIEMWKQRGVPLHIVLRGINASFDAYDKRAHRRRKVNSLLYCQQEVEAMFVEYCESRVGAEVDSVMSAERSSLSHNGSDNHREEYSPFTPAAIINFLDELSVALEKLCAEYSPDAVLTETFTRSALRLAQIIEDLRSIGKITPESLELDLTMIEEVILDGLKASAGEDGIERLKQEGHRQLRSYRQNMERDIYQQTINNFIARRLREQYRVPRLSLFYL